MAGNESAVIKGKSTVEEHFMLSIHKTRETMPTKHFCEIPLLFNITCQSLADPSCKVPSEKQGVEIEMSVLPSRSKEGEKELIHSRQNITKHKYIRIPNRFCYDPIQGFPP